MQKFDSISHFIQSGDFNYRIFDMGRKVTPIDQQTFEQIENQTLAYPYPFQQKAKLALLIWEKDKPHESVIWFLQFPIDELGYLKQQSRDAFLIELLEQAGKNILAKQKGKPVLDELNESPFAFTPSPPFLAIFHAFATRELNQAASQYYQHAHHYLTGETGFEQWQFLGLQGIADVIARLDQDNNESLLTKAIPSMPNEPLLNFAQMLENTSVSKNLFDALAQRLKKEIAQENPNALLIAALLRGISSADNDLKQQAILDTLNSPMGDNIEILAAISGRSWESLKDPTLLAVFLEKIAQHQTPAFNAILTDLLMIPGMREPILSAMRNPKRSAEVSKKLGELLKTIIDTKNVKKGGDG